MHEDAREAERERERIFSLGVLAVHQLFDVLGVGKLRLARLKVSGDNRLGGSVS